MTPRKEITRLAAAFAVSHAPDLPVRPEDLHELTVEDAYHVQRAALNLRKQRGEYEVGYKVGCVSRAIRQQFGLSYPICGRLMHPHVHEGDSVLESGQFVEPAVEPEIALRIGSSVDSEQTSRDELIAAIEGVAPAIEVHHLRWRCGRPTSQELIASNGIHACVVLAHEVKLDSPIDWKELRFDLRKNRMLHERANGREIMGDPLASVVWLTSHLAARGEYLKAGDLVIPGSPVRLVSVEAGDAIEAVIHDVGSASVQFV